MLLATRKLRCRVMLAVVYWPLEACGPRAGNRGAGALGTTSWFLFGSTWCGACALSFLSPSDAQVHGALPAAVRDGFLALPRAAQLLAHRAAGRPGGYCSPACHRSTCSGASTRCTTASDAGLVAAHREHPVDGLLTQLTLNLPAILLGFPVEGLAALAVFRGLGPSSSTPRAPAALPLRYVLGAPELHHWHHAKAPGVVANYGNLSP